MQKRKVKHINLTKTSIFILMFGLLILSPFKSIQAACGDAFEAPCPTAAPTTNGQIPAQNGQIPARNGQIPAKNGQIPSSSGLNINTGIQNPLGGNVPDIPAFIGIVINFVLMIGVPIVALAFIYSGFLFVTSLGNSEKLTKAKKTFVYTLIGAAILLGAFVIANAIKGTVDCIASNDTTCK